MPRAHSATVIGLTTATAIVYGTGGFEFPMALFFAIIVMYDAVGVRLETGREAKALNRLRRRDLQEHKQPDSRLNVKVPFITSRMIFEPCATNHAATAESSTLFVTNPITYSIQSLVSFVIFCSPESISYIPMIFHKNQQNQLFLNALQVCQIYWTANSKKNFSRTPCFSPHSVV